MPINQTNLKPALMSNIFPDHVILKSIWVSLIFFWEFLSKSLFVQANLIQISDAIQGRNSLYL